MAATGPASGAPAPPPAPADAPYRGLTPYSEQDALLFFGREPESELVIANMMASRLTLLYGASGVGKTSLLRAGVAHRLLTSARHNVITYGSPEFVVVYFNRWKEDPLQCLITEIDESAAAFTDGGPGEQERAEPEPSAQECGTGGQDLAEAVGRWTAALDCELLIILDQFEEYLLYHRGEDGNETFAVQFPRVVKRADLRVSFLVAIREDALAGLDRFKGRLPGLFDNYLRLRHLDSRAGREAIEGPLAAYSRLVSAQVPFTADPELVATVLAQVQIGQVAIGAVGRGDVGPAPGSAASVGEDRRVETPYLQLVLMRLWREESAAGSSVLRAETLARLGGAQEIVRTHLDEELDRLPPRQQDIAAAVFHFLVTASGAKIAHTVRDLADYAQFPEIDVAAVLEELSSGEARILRPVAPTSGLSGQAETAPAYEIFHDVLAPAVLGWWTRHAEARAAEARLQEKVEHSAEKARAAEERARRYRLRVMGLSVVVLVLLLALATVVAVWAVRGQRSAEGRKKVAESAALSAQSLSQLDVDPGSSVGSALEALSRAGTREAEDALRRGLSEARVRVVFGGRNAPVSSASLTPDGRFVLTGGADSTVRVWDINSGRQVAQLRTSSATSPLFSERPQLSRDGTLALVTGTDHTVQVWRWRGHDRPTVVSRDQDVRVAALSPDGEHVVTGHEDGTVRVWAWRTGRAPVVLGRAGGDPVVSVAFSSDGRIAAGGRTGIVRLWLSASSAEPMVLAGQQAPVNAVVFSPDGRLLVTTGADADGTAWVFSVPEGRPLAQLTGHSAQVTSVAFSQDSQWVVTASVDHTARVFSARDGRPVAVLAGHADEVADAVFSPDARLVATASSDGTSRLWYAHPEDMQNVQTGAALLVLRGHQAPLYAVAFSSDGGSVVTASGDGTGRRWDVDTGRVYWGHEDVVNSAVFSPDGRQVLTASGDKARIFDAATGRQDLPPLVEPGGVINSAAFSADGRRVAMAGFNAENQGVARVWSLAEPATGKVVALAPKNQMIYTAEFSRDGRLVTTTRTEATIWDLDTGHPVVRLRLPPEEVTASPFAVIATAVFSPDGAQVLTAQLDNMAQLWDARTGQRVRRLQGHTGVVTSAVFSRDGSRIVTASRDGTARVWDARTGRLLHVLHSVTGPLRWAAFNPDAGWVVAGSVDGSAQVWDVPGERLLAILHQHAGPVITAVFSADGSRILTASEDRTAKSYSCQYCLPLNELLPIARPRADLTSTP